MGNKVASFGKALYNPKQKQFLGRDGAGWVKLGTFYCFFYLGLAGFVCSMLAVFMALTPRDHPRYFSESSRMRTRSHPLTPGLGFRPQPSVENNLITIDRNSNFNEPNLYLKSLEQYMYIYYWENDDDGKHIETRKFTISNPGDCTPANYYGFARGKPCVLVKMNKIVGFEPQPGYRSEDEDVFKHAGCQQKPDAVSVHCYGEYAADRDNIGKITYISENNRDDKCGSLDTKWFPYTGKKNRRDAYQAPYIWVQFENPKPNVLINVMCRVFAKNIHFDKKSSRAMTRFQIYLNDLSDRTG